MSLTGKMSFVATENLSNECATFPHVNNLYHSQMFKYFSLILV